MATVDEITQVRLNANVPDDVEPYTDSYISGLIDGLGVDKATASIWRSKAASVADLVDVTEAGASHKMSDLFKHYTAMADKWDDIDEEATSGTGPKVKVIERRS